MKISELETLAPYVWREGATPVYPKLNTVISSGVVKDYTYKWYASDMKFIQNGDVFVVVEPCKLVSNHAGHFVSLNIIGGTKQFMGWVTINATAMNPNRKPARLKIEHFKKPYDGPKH